MKKSLPIVFLAGILVGFGLLEADRLFERSDVESAQKLIGLDFNAAEIDTMLTYLERNRKGYDSMRTYRLENDITPAMVFNPFPTELTIQPGGEPIDWQINENVVLPDNDEDIAFLTVYQLAGLIKSGKLSSERLTNIYLKRIEAYDDKLLSFITVTSEVALAQAKKADEEIAQGKYRGPLHGIPYGIKDLAAYPGYPTTWGSAPYKDQIIDQKATIIAKLEAAGAVMLGKLVSGALARGDVWFGGKTKNPWDLEEGASGSSAGAGSATAAGLVAFSIGTETLGSIVSPSTRCGVTGLRPTYGRISRSGVMSLSWSMDKLGPIARSATDCAIVLDAVHGQDPKDQTAISGSFSYLSKEEMANWKVGYFHEQFESDSSDNAINNDKTLATLEALGLNPEPVDLPLDYPFNVFDIILRAEAGAFFDELLLAGLDSTMVEQDARSRANSLRQSRFIPAVEYLQANRHRRNLINEFHNAIKDYDVIISPTFGGRQMQITNLTGHPALAMPNGFDEDGNPTSITLVGNYFEEEKLIYLAEQFQKATDFDEQRPMAYKQ